MDPRSKVLQKPIYQAIFKIWGAESSFINTGICISHQFVQFNRPFFLVDHRFSSFSMGVTVVTLFNIPSL